MTPYGRSGAVASPIPPDKIFWAIQPLIETGLQPGEIRTLMFRLSFDAIVAGGDATAASIDAAVSDQPSCVQRAWALAIHRLSVLEEIT